MPVSLTPKTPIYESTKNTLYSNLNKPTAKKTNNQSVQLLKTAAKGQRHQRKCHKGLGDKQLGSLEAQGPLALFAVLVGRRQHEKN